MEERERDRVARLTDIAVDAVGLVFSPANRREFYFLKSQNQDGGERMSDNYEGVLQELEAVEEVSKTAWDKALGFMRELYSQLKGNEPDPEPPPAGEPEGYAEALAAATKEMEERFSAQLAAESQKREEFAQAYEAERRKRRLVEFGDVIATDFSQLATGEDFAEALLELSDHSAELYEKFHGILKAANALVKEAGVFEQRSRAGAPAGSDPFLAAVEKVRQERFASQDYNEGFVAAMKVVEAEQPKLAAGYDLAGGN